MVNCNRIESDHFTTLVGCVRENSSGIILLKDTNVFMGQNKKMGGKKTTLKK